MPVCNLCIGQWITHVFTLKPNGVQNASPSLSPPSSHQRPQHTTYSHDLSNRTTEPRNVYTRRIKPGRAALSHETGSNYGGRTGRLAVAGRGEAANRPPTPDALA